MDEMFNFPIEKISANLNVRIMMNPIPEQMNIEYMIVQESDLSLIIGSRKWLNAISVLFAQLNLPGTGSEDDVRNSDDYAISSELLVDGRPDLSPRRIRLVICWNSIYK
jgi:hypothetical protein